MREHQPCHLTLNHCGISATCLSFQTVMLGTDESQSCWFQVSQSCYLRTGCLGFDQGWFGRKADAVFSPEQTTLWALPPPGLGMEERKQKSPLYVVVRNLTWPGRGKIKEPHCSSTLNALCRRQSTLTLRLVRTKGLGFGQKQKQQQKSPISQ